MHTSFSRHRSATGDRRIRSRSFTPLHRHRVPRLALTIAGATWALCATAALDAQSPAAGAARSRQQLLVTPAWLAAHGTDPHLVVLDVGEESDYLAGHIPGARWVDIAVISANADMEHHSTSALMLEMLPPDQLRTRLANLGITDRSRVVVYANKDWVSPATRVLFTLAYAGLGDQSAFLDGGLPAWRRESRPVTATPTAPPSPSAPLTVAARPSLIVDAAWVRQHLDAPGVRIVDARDRVYYDGTEKAESRRGHVHGAASLPYTSVTDANLQLRPAAELTALFQAAGIAPGDTVVAYCHVGQQATAVLFAAETLGHPVRLYDGSFEDWSRRADVPVDDPSAAAGKSR